MLLRIQTYVQPCSQRSATDTTISTFWAIERSTLQSLRPRLPGSVIRLVASTQPGMQQTGAPDNRFLVFILSCLRCAHVFSRYVGLFVPEVATTFTIVARDGIVELG
eukprot:1393758-Amorphochlora_amoeboformis.AAC.2